MSSSSSTGKAGDAASNESASAATAAAQERRETLEAEASKKGAGSMTNQLFCMASEAAATDEASVLPPGHTLVVAAKPHTQGQIGEKLRVPAPDAADNAAALQPFSCLRCLTHPEVAAEPSLTQGYGRLQVLLAYLLPEVTETLEEEDPAALLQKGSAAAAAAEHGSPVAGSEKKAAAAAAANEGAAAGGGSSPAESSSSAAHSNRATPQEFTVTALNPTRGYVRLSLNGVPVYRSSVLKISPDGLNEAAAVLQGKKEEAKLPKTIFNERVEIQIHEPYSVLRVQLFNRDVTLGVVADDDLLGVFEVPIHLLKPRKIYDIEAEFPPQVLREENEEWISGQGLESPFVLGEKRLLPPAATAQLLQTKHIFDPEVAAAAAADELPAVEPTSSSPGEGGVTQQQAAAAAALGTVGADSSSAQQKEEGEAKAKFYAGERQTPERRGTHALQQEARQAAAAAHSKLASSSHGDIDLLSCPLNLAAAAAASAPQMGGFRSSSFSLESRSTTVDERDLTTAAVATGTAALQQQQHHLLPDKSSDAKQQQQQPKETTARPPLLPLGCCACGPRLRCLFKMEIVGAGSLAQVGLAKEPLSHGAAAAAAELCALALPVAMDDAAAAARLPPLNMRKLWHDVKRLKFLVWDCVLNNVAETVGLLPTWKKPLLSAACLFALILVTVQPMFLYPSYFFLLGLLLLLLSQTSVSTTPAAAVAAASVLVDTKRKPPAAVLVPGAAAAAAEKERKGEAPPGSAPAPPPPPPSLEAFEAQQQSDDARLEDSLLKGLLSAAIPKAINHRLRVFHRTVLAAISVVVRMHHKLRMRREPVVGTLWILSILSLYFPEAVGALIRYSLGGAGVLVMIRRMPVVGTALRLIAACVAYARLLYERTTKQHLVAAPAIA